MGYKKNNKVMLIKSGYYPSVASITNIIQLKFDEEDIPLFVYEEDDKVILTNRNSKLDAILYFAPYLCKILGFEQASFHFGAGPIKYNSEIETQINLLTPRNLIVGCNIVDDTIFGGQHVKLLRLITNSDNLESDLLTFEFLHDEKINLGIQEFKSIHISILDATGSPIKSESIHPSRLQLMFSLE